MTTTSPIRLRSPSDLLAVIPHVLGFHPTRSVVLVSLRRRRISLTERSDLPTDAEVARAAERMIQPILRENPDSALMVGYETDVGESLPILEQLTRLMDRRGVPVVDRLVVRAGRWRSLDCTSPDCCPQDGSVLPTPSESARVLAEFVGEGVVPLASRAGLEAMIEAGPGAVRVADLIAGTEHREPQPTHSDRNRKAQGHAWARLLDTAPRAPVPDPQDVALVLPALRDVQVRDGIVALLMPSTLAPDRLPQDVRKLTDAITTAVRIDNTDPTAQRAVQARLIALCQLSPDVYAAPALTILAAYSWWRGDGATARVALARALRCEPGYRLAQLLDMAVDLAIRPPGD